jgi:hypothetical protein
MRAIILAVLVAAGIGLAAGASTVSAAPASGVTINESATVNNAVVNVHWRGRSGWRRGGRWGGGGGCHYRYRSSWGPCY